MTNTEYNFEVRDEDGKALAFIRANGYVSAFAEYADVRLEDIGSKWHWEGFGAPGVQHFSFGVMGGCRFTVHLRQGACA
jgi:hypothetical protein